MLFTMIGLDEDAAPDKAGIWIFIGLLRNVELIPILVGIVTVAADVVAMLFSTNAAAVSRSLPPPANKKNINFVWLDL